MKHYLETFMDVLLRKWELPALTDYKGKEYTYCDVASEIEKLHMTYAAIGLRPGDKVALCGRNCSRWAVAFLANGLYRTVSVPILYDFTPEAVTRLVDHSESSMLFTDSRTWSRMSVPESGHLRAVVSLDDCSCLWSSDEAVRQAFDSAQAAFDAKHPFGLKRTDVDYSFSSPNELAVINYTSGTTGDPKGVMLPVRSLSANVAYGLANVPVKDDDRSLSMLPMAHMSGLSFEFLYAFCGGSHVYFLGRTPSPSTLLAAFAEVRPYILVTVPLVMEKLVRSKVLPVLQKRSVKILTSVPGVRSIVYKMIRGRLMEAFGGNIREIPMGGAALNPAVEDALRKLKVPYTVGYGMTECGPLVSYAAHGKYRKGSCGAQLGGFSQIRIDSDDPRRVIGEVQVKGDNVMLGYYKNETATRAAFTDDGWLRTGDLGLLGRDGSIYLKGRSKCMILSSNGQNIYPEEIEAVLNSQPEVEESLVISSGGRLVALLSLVQEGDKSIADVLRERVNKALPSYSRIASCRIMTEPFVHTPKHSIKRALYTGGQLL